MINAKVLTLGVSIISAAVGAAAGYIYAKRELEETYAAVAEEEIAKARDFYSALHKKDEYSSPEKIVEKLIENNTKKNERNETNAIARAAKNALVDYNGISTKSVVAHSNGQVDSGDPDEPETEETPVINEPSKGTILFEGVALNVTEWDLDAELMNRKLGKPYVISEEEWSANDEEYERQTLTYWRNDDVLTDEDENVIDELDKTVGQDNMKRFGHGCDDPNVVFIRNEHMATDFEVLQHHGSYAEEVLGLPQDDEPHLEHSAMPRRRRVLEE